MEGNLNMCHGETLLWCLNQRSCGLVELVSFQESWWRWKYTSPSRPLWGEIRRCHGEPLWSRPQSTRRLSDPRKIWRRGGFRRPSLTASNLHLHVSFWSPASQNVHHREERRGDVRCCVCFSSVHNLRPSAAALMLCCAAVQLFYLRAFQPVFLLPQQLSPAGKYQNIETDLMAQKLALSRLSSCSRVPLLAVCLFFLWNTSSGGSTRGSPILSLCNFNQ